MPLLPNAFADVPDCFRPLHSTPGRYPLPFYTYGFSPHRYPYNLDFDFSALEGLQKFSINNLGDPFIESNYGVHSREFEVSRTPFRSASISVTATLQSHASPGVQGS